MSLGRTFEEAILKAVRSLETGLYHLDSPIMRKFNDEELEKKILAQDDERIWPSLKGFAVTGHWIEFINSQSLITSFLKRSKTLFSLKKNLKRVKH